MPHGGLYGTLQAATGRSGKSPTGTPTTAVTETGTAGTWPATQQPPPAPLCGTLAAPQSPDPRITPTRDWKPCGWLLAGPAGQPPLLPVSQNARAAETYTPTIPRARLAYSRSWVR